MDGERYVARKPLGTVRTKALADIYAAPAKEAARLKRLGKLHRLATGYYCAVPPNADAKAWKPTLEAATGGIATAIFGPKVPILMGLTAARLHQAIPRAIGGATVATPRQHRPIKFMDRPGEVTFEMRDVARLDAELMQTDLGPVLVTTPAQTLLDLARDTHPDETTKQAIKTLNDMVTGKTLGEIAVTAKQRAALARVFQLVA